MNAETEEEIHQYYTVRCSEWHMVTHFKMNQLMNGCWIVDLFYNALAIGKSVYIPFSLRGKGLFKESLSNIKHSKVVTMKDCHVTDVLNKYHRLVFVYSSLSDNMFYRDLRNSLCHLKDKQGNFILPEINNKLTSISIPMKYQLLKNKNVDDIIEMLNE